MKKEFEGLVALVTGASSGIGLAIAQSLASHGAKTILNGRDESKLVRLEKEFVDKGWSVGRSVFDVGDKISVDLEIERLAEREGHLDILINNAGIVNSLDIFETTLNDWQSVLNTNLTGPFLCSKAALRIMREQNSGRIIMISSTAGQRGSPTGVVSYSASKAGVIGLAQSLAYTAADFGVTVNVVAPGIIESDMLRKGLGSKLKETIQKVPLGLGHPNDIARAVLYLAGESGRYITGTTIDVNGGLYVR